MTTPIEIYKFETLYCLDKAGKLKQWDIRVENKEKYSEIITIYGYTRKIETNTRITNGKNLKKSNATTHYTQAIADAQSKWNKKKDIEGYTVVMLTRDGTINTTSFGGVTPLPMLAQEFNKNKKKVVYPVAIQCKLDGYRSIYNSNTNQITTRQGKDFLIITKSGKLYEELQQLKKYKLIFDGELYCQNVPFETFGVLRKTKGFTETDLENLSKIEYHIYDIIDTEISFKERNEILNKINKENTFSKLKFVETLVVSSEEEIKENHTRYLSEGYEGTIVRTLNGLYKCKFRSFDLLKYKDFQDAEFEIVDFTEEKDTSGADSNLIVWIVKVNETNKCRVRPQGTKKERQELYKKCVENFNQFKGRKLWTKFFEFTGDRNLRFPTSKTNSYESYIRDEIL
jgi:ATP-dependent DNA ligase